jgi:hypothetical protein
MMATPKASSSDTRAPRRRLWPLVTPTDPAATFSADDAIRSDDHLTILSSAAVVTWLSWSCSPARSETSDVASVAVSPPAVMI